MKYPKRINLPFSPQINSFETYFDENFQNYENARLIWHKNKNKNFHSTGSMLNWNKNNNKGNNLLSK